MREIHDYIRYGHGCRCEKCRTSWAEYYRRLRKRKKEAEARRVTSAPDGTLSYKAILP